MFHNVVNNINRAIKQKQSTFFIANTKTNIKVLTVLWDNHLISRFKVKDDNILVDLKFSSWGVFLIKEINLISKPGRRVFLSKKNINNVSNKLYFFSSDKDLTTNKDLIGGELLFVVCF